MPYLVTTAVLLVTVIGHVLGGNTNSQSSATVEAGSFQSPSALVRPRFRYWLPDPSVDPAVVRNDIHSAAAIGSGGIEYLPWYNAGGVLGGAPPGADWSKYGFGAPESNKMFIAALEAHRDAGLVMDFSIGPDQGQGVPAEMNNEGLQWDLIPSMTALDANEPFNGTIPGWGTGDLVALVSAEVLSVDRIINSTSPLGGQIDPYSRLVLKHDTLTDRTLEVSPSGHLSLSITPSPRGTHHHLFAFYQRLTHGKNLEFHSDASETIFDNGSYKVDHFSAKGAEVVIKFWEDHILDDRTKALLAEVGHYAWEDSVELKSNISWTPSLPQIFEQKYGYSINKYLPLIMFGNNNLGLQPSQLGNVECLLDTPSRGVGYINDYRGVLGEGNKRYLETLNSWVKTALNLQFSTQVSYNLPMDMEAMIPLVDVPECESLGFFDSIDGYRQYTGPAVLTDKRVISNEIGAVSMKAYQYLTSSLLWSINRAVAGGVNQFVIHGQSYTGTYYATTWPGYTAFSYFYAESWSNKQPVWDNGFSDLLEYVARLQQTQQSGKLLVDVAIYNKESATDFTFASKAEQLTDLIEDGYSFNYLSPANFDVAQARVDERILAPDGPAYKAMVIPSTTNVTLDSIHKLQKLAQDGLLVILSGGDPQYFQTSDGGDKANFMHAIAVLKNQTNVHSVPSGRTTDKLASLGLHPRIRLKANGTWYTTWRESVQEKVHFAFIYNDGPASEGHIEVPSEKVPYKFNLWTGGIKPIFNYRQMKGKIIIPLRMEANQTTLIGFSDQKLDSSIQPTFHATQVPASVLGFEYSTNASSVEIHIATGECDCPLLLSTGKKYSAIPSSTVAPGFLLSNWSLTAEHWEAPRNMSDASPIAFKYNTTHQLPSLVSWAQIPGLVNASGLGYYSASFDWAPSTSSADGAYAVFPQILHGLRVQVNGIRTPPLDFNDPRIDIGPYLRDGKNEILAIVPTTMWNYLRSIFGEIVMSGYPPLITITSPGYLPDTMDNGLVGVVKIVPYATVKVEA